ncbi:tandem-95 repeat protein [Pseudomonas sp. NFXW11]|uniref:Ig-like domain-containing protein n=1 Tax=Pseudomonas sp. NFXW11 TaxID=2819531 RepID=UPI003CF3B478
MLLDAAAAKTLQQAVKTTPAAPADTADTQAHANLVAALGSVGTAAPQPAAPTAAAHEVYFIDMTVAQPGVLAQDLPAGAEVHYIPQGVDGVRFIAQTLVGRSNISAIQIISHGEEDMLFLGTDTLTLLSMQSTYRAELAQIGASLAPGGDILLYGCDFGKGSDGAQAVETLSSITGANVAAATGDVGAANLGGSWTLDRQSGPIDVASVSAPDWEHLLAPPTLTSTNSLSYSGTENSGAPVNGTAAGVLVSSYTVNETDSNPGSHPGIALTGADTTNGTWWYSLNGGSTWNSVGAVSSSSALLLPGNASTYLYFQPNSNFFGSAGNALTLLAWDQTAGTAGIQVNPNSIAGAVSTASNTVAVAVNEVFYAPTLTPLNQTIWATMLNDGVPQGAVGSQVSNLLTGVSDVNAGTAEGIAITGASSQGTLYYYGSSSGTWQSVSSSSLSNTNALLLGPTNLIYFMPSSYANGNIANALTFRAWDQQSGTVYHFADTSSNGGTTAFSSATDTLNMVINTRPVINAPPPTFNAPDNTSGPLNGTAVGVPVSALTGNFSDTGQATQMGIAISAYNGALGVWWYTANNGANWYQLPSNLGSTNVLLLGGSDARIYLQSSSATASGNQGIGLYMYAWDMTAGTSGNLFNASVNTAFSSSYTTMNLSSGQYPPVVDLDSTSPGINFNAAYYDGRNNAAIALFPTVSDPDGANIASMSVTLSNPTAADSLYLTQAVAGISSSYNASTGVLSLSGSSAPVNYQIALGNIRFSTSNTAPIAHTITVSAVASDIATPSATASATLTLYDNNGSAPTTSVVTPATAATTGANPSGNTIATTIDGASGANVPYYRDAGPIAMITYTFSTPLNDLRTVQIFNNGGSNLGDNQAMGEIGTLEFFNASGGLITSTTAYYTPNALPDGATGGEPYQIDAGSLNGVAKIELLNTSGRGDQYVAFNEFNVITGNDIPQLQNPGITGQSFNASTGNYAATTAQDVAFNGQVLAADPDGEALTYAISSQPSHGTLTLNASTGTYIYTPTLDYNGGDTFVVTANDGHGATVQSTVSMTVTPVTDIANDTASTNENTLVNINVLANDSFQNPSHTITAINGTAVSMGTPLAVSNGAVTLQANGTLNFQPATNYYGSTSFTYTVSSGGVNETATVTVAVDALPQQQDPGLAGQTFNASTGNYSATTTQDVAYNGQVSATDPDGNTLTYSLVGQPSHGAVSLNSSTGAYTYTPTLDYHGSDSFSVSISDGQGATVQSTVSMTVTPVTDIANDSASTIENTAVTINVLANDSFQNPGHTITAINGTAVSVGTPLAVSNGSVTLQANGTLNFQPANNYYGSTSFTYTVSSGGVNETATVSVLVDALPQQQDPGVAGQNFNPSTGNYSAITPQDMAYNGQVSATDPDGNTLTYSLVGQPSHGTVSVNASTGAYTYTPTLDYHGTDSFAVSISDGHGATVQSSVSMTVTPVTDIANDSASTVENTAATINVLANDSFQNPSHTITAINGTAVSVGTPLAVSNGTVTLQANGMLNFQPATNYYGSTSFTYTVSSGGVNETATVSVNINGVPQFESVNVTGESFNAGTGNYAATTEQNTAFNGQVMAVDPDGETLTYAISSQPGHGTLTLNASTGAYTYTPTADYNGNDSFVVTANDGHGATAQSSVGLTVTPVTEIANDTASTNENTPVNINVLANDSFQNPDRYISQINGTAITQGTPLTVGNGSVTLEANGTLDFQPATHFYGTTSFTYTVNSGGVNETATVTVTVNALPVLQDPGLAGQNFNASTGNYSASTPQDVAYSGQVEATDPDGSTLSYSASAEPSHGSLTLNASTGAYTYTPTLDYHGSDSFSVTISDGHGATLQSTVNMTVTPVTDIANDSASTLENTAVTINVLANDSFQNSERYISQINGTAITQGTPLAVSNGTVTLQADGTLYFQPSSNYYGSTSFAYTVSSGGVNETATVTVAVDALPQQQDPGVAGQTFNPGTGNYSASTTQDVAYNGQVSATDPDGNTLTYSLVGQPGHGTVSLNASTGAYTYTPTLDYHGSDSFTVAVSDAQGATVQSSVDMTITPVSDIANDSASTIENTPVTINVLANDSFQNPGRYISQINGTAVGQGTPLAVNNGTVTLQADGTLNFQPANNYYGTTSFTYTVSSGGVNETATVSVLVDALPQLQDPGTTGQSFDSGTGNYSASTTQDVAYSGQVEATDPDGNTLSYTLNAQPLHGSVSINSATGAYTYTPTLDYHGSDNFTVAISDGHGATVQSSVSMTVTPVTDIANDSVVTQENSPVNIDVFAADSFQNPDHSIIAINGTAVAVGAPLAVSNGSVTLQADGTLNFQPATHFYGSTSFTYTVSSGGVNETATVSVTVNALPVLQDPGLAGQSFNANTGNYSASTPQDVAYSGQVEATDPDGSTLSYSTSTQPGHGTLSLNASTGAYTYTPTLDYHGSDSFSVTISDGHGATLQSTVSMTVTPVTDIANDSASTIENAPITINVLANDSFQNSGRYISQINGTAITQGTPLAVSNGTVTLRADGTLYFQPSSNYYGSTSFTYTVSSGGVNETATVTVAVDALPQQQDPGVAGQTFNPGTGNYSASTTQDVAYNGQVSATDPDGNTLTYSLVGQPGHGTVSLNASTGAYTYTPTLDYHGSDSFTVAVSDAQGATVQSSVSMTVTPVTDIANDSASTIENAPVTINVLANDSFQNSGRYISQINGTAITQGTPLAVSNGTVTLQADGTLYFQPSSNYYGSTSFTYTVSSGGVNETATVTVAVDALPQQQDPGVAGQSLNPSTGNYSATTTQDVTYNGQVSASDPDGNTLTYSLAGQPGHGTVSLNASTGAYTYTPTLDYHGSDNFTVAISDGHGATVQSSVSMTVTPVTDIANDSASTIENTPIDIEVLANDSFQNSERYISQINGTAITQGTPLAVSNGTVTLQADGSLYFQPTTHYYGNTSFTYTVNSGGVNETATVTVAVDALPQQQDPGVTGQTFNASTGNYSATTTQDVAYNGQVSATDPDGNILSYSLVGQPSHGAVSLNSSTGAYTYTPTLDYHGSDNFTVAISDGHGATVQSSVSMTVTPVTDIANDSASTIENTAVTINVLANDSFQNPSHTITAINGTAVSVGTPLAVSNGTVTLQANGMLNFQPATNYYGSTSFTYTISSGGVNETATVSVLVDALPQLRDPGATGQTFTPGTGSYNATTTQDVAYNGQVSATDPDGNTLTYSLAGQPSHGTVSVNASTGAYTYTPTLDYHGSDSFAVSISDGHGATVQSSVSMTVTPVTDIANDSASTNENTAVSINVLANDSFRNPDHRITAIDGVAVSVGTPLVVSNGSVVLEADGTLTFQPAEHFHGNTRFSYTVTSGGVEAMTNVEIRVNATTPTVVDSTPTAPANSAPKGLPGESISVHNDSAIESRARLDIGETPDAAYAMDNSVIIDSAVNAIASLNGQAAPESMEGAVCRVVNEIDHLAGIEALPEKGVVLQATHALSALHGINEHRVHDTRSNPASLLHRGLEWNPMASATDILSSLRPASGPHLELLGQGNDFWLTASGDGEAGRIVRVELEGARALPEWIRSDQGTVFINRPANVEQLRLRVTTVSPAQRMTSRVIEIDLLSGQMRDVHDTPIRSVGKIAASTAALPFNAQLERALQSRRAADATLLELLGKP